MMSPCVPTRCRAGSQVPCWLRICAIRFGRVNCPAELAERRNPRAFVMDTRFKVLTAALPIAILAAPPAQRVLADQNCLVPTAQTQWPHEY
jgi:hypothetical protein